MKMMETAQLHPDGVVLFQHLRRIAIADGRGGIAAGGYPDGTAGRSLAEVYSITQVGWATDREVHWRWTERARKDR